MSKCENAGAAKASRRDHKGVSRSLSVVDALRPPVKFGRLLRSVYPVPEHVSTFDIALARLAVLEARGLLGPTVRRD